MTVTSFETNDDALFMLFASGFYTGSPFEYLIATPLITGCTLKFLYEYFEGINWYGWYLLICHFVAYIAFFYAATKIYKSYSVFLVITTVLIFFESYFFAYIQFTSTAFMCGISGCFLVLSSYLNKQNFPSIVLGSFLIFMGILVRPVIFGYMLSIFLPAAVYVFYKTRNQKIILTSVIIIVGFFALESFDSNFQGSFVKWKQYKNYFNHEFHGLADAPSIHFQRPIEEILSKINWTINDYDMLRVGFFEDTAIYSEKNIKYLFQESQISYSPFVFEQFSNLKNILWTYKYQTGLIFVILIYFMFSKPLDKKITILFTLGILCLLVYVMGTFTILKPRIIIPSLMIVAIISVLLYSFQIEKLINIWWKGLILIFFSILMVFKMNLNSRENIEPRTISYKYEFNGLNKSFPGKVLAIWQTSLPFDNINVIENIYHKNSSIKFYYLDWLSGFPVQKELLKMYKQSDIYHALLTEDFLLLLDNSHTNRLELLKTYFKEHFGLNVVPYKVEFSIPEEELLSFSVYKFKIQ